MAGHQEHGSKSAPYSRGLATAYVSGGELAFSRRMSRWILRNFYKGRTGRMLDLACGAGEAVRVFGAAGWQAAGLDRSEAMLEIARARNPSAHLQLGTMQDCRPAGSGFDLVTCMYDAINCNLRIADLDATLRNVRSLLAPGGRFVFDAFSVEGLGRAYDGLELHTRNRDDVVLTSAWFDPRRNIGVKELLGASRHEQWRPWREVHRVRAYPPGLLVERLERAGFESPELYDWPGGRSASVGKANALDRFVVAARRR